MKYWDAVSVDTLFVNIHWQVLTGRQSVGGTLWQVLNGRHSCFSWIQCLSLSHLFLLYWKLMNFSLWTTHLSCCGNSTQYMAPRASWTLKQRASAHFIWLCFTTFINKLCKYYPSSLQWTSSFASISQALNWTGWIMWCSCFIYLAASSAILSITPLLQQQITFY